MTNITFITGNQNKADYLAKYLGFTISHKKLDLVEIQSLDIKQVVEHKVLEAYKIFGSPVLVEDVALEFKALGRLPGTFIKFFMSELSFESICRMLDKMDRSATAKSAYAYYDGFNLQIFESSLIGSIAEHPKGTNGWGWDQIFIPEGYSRTRAELDEAEDKETYLKIKPLGQMKIFFENLDSQNDT